MVNPPQDGDKADWAAAMLSADIISGVLKPGDKLSEPQLARRLGISRAPLREAIRRLEGRRLVTRKAKIGVHVAAFSTQDFIGLLHVREGLEGIAARLAAQNIDEAGIAELRALCALYESRIDDRAGMLDADVAFHTRIAQASGSAMVTSMLCDDFFPSFRVWRRSYPRRPDRAETALRQHLAIVDALAARDAEHAEYLMRHHVRTSREAFLAVVQDELPGSPPAAPAKTRTRKNKPQDKP